MIINIKSIDLKNNYVTYQKETINNNFPPNYETNEKLAKITT